MRRSLFILLSLAVCSSALVACGGSQSSTATPTAAVTATTAAFGRPSTSFQLTGLVSHPGTFTLADLQALPKVTVMINTQPLGAHSFGGALLYGLLQQAGIVTVSTRKNDILRKTVLVTGTDGYGVAVALGEIIPRFANRQVILAYEEDGKPLPQADGFARLVVPGNAFAGRYVSNVAQVSVASPGPIPTLESGTPSNSFYLVGQVMHCVKCKEGGVSSPDLKVGASATAWITAMRCSWGACVPTQRRQRCPARCPALSPVARPLQDVPS